MATTVAHAHHGHGVSTHGLFDDVAAWFSGWLAIHRTENELAELTPHQLRDIGLVGPNLPREYRDALLHGQSLY
jgi:uncharacterized protein YjiS (DUF1127 family)